jgi:hypothetical protein
MNMGRTIHYLVEDDGQNHITDEEWQKIEELQERYNSDFKWSCERLSLERINISPNWSAWDETGLRANEVWRRIETELKKPNGIQSLLDHGLIEVSKGGYRGSKYLMSGFTKVRDDEYNAGLVIEFLIKASLIAPRIQIRVHDEGDYLACPVIIQNGIMKPDETEIKSQMAYWKTLLNESPADEMEFWIGLIAKHKQYLSLEDSNLDNSAFITPLPSQ